MRLDVVFEGGPAYSLNEYFHSFSYDGEEWHPVHWELGYKVSKQSDTLVFPEFEEDVVYVGHQVPMSYEKMLELVEAWRAHPAVTVKVIGKSLGGRDIVRVTLTDPDSPHPVEKRWAHHFANQHPGEHNAQWRMAGMVDWLLSEEGRDALQRTVAHFVLMSSPDAPSHGWYRINDQGYDMNRTYRVEGADKEQQAHEAFILQRDLEELMASSCPPVTTWSMHTWGGVVDPLIIPGPEMNGGLGPWTVLRDIIAKHDTNGLVKGLQLQSAKADKGMHWTDGPHLQFGITAVLCEGAGNIYTKRENLESGAVLMKAVAEYYRGTR